MILARVMSTVAVPAPMRCECAVVHLLDQALGQERLIQQRLQSRRLSSFASGGARKKSSAMLRKA